MSRKLAAIIGTAALALGTPAAAHAERWTSADPAGDSFDWALDSEAPCAPEAITATPDDQASDLTRIRVAHSRDTVQFGAKFGKAVAPEGRMMSFYVDTPGRAYLVQAVRGPSGGWPPQMSYAFAGAVPRGIATASCEQLTTVDSRRGFGDRRPCMELPVRVVDSSMTVSVPRECLGTPRWVRVGAYTMTFQDDDDVTGFDTWLPSGQQPSGFVIGAVGPRVRPGR